MVSGFIGWSRDKRGVPTYHCVDVCNTITSSMGGTTTPLVYEYNDKTLLNEGEDKRGVAELASVPRNRNRSGLLQCDNGCTKRLPYNPNLRVRSVAFRGREVKEKYVCKVEVGGLTANSLTRALDISMALILYD